MVPYSQYELTEQQLKVLTKTKVRRAVRKYIRENGHEPSQEEMDAFAVLTTEDIERFKAYCYSVAVTREMKQGKPSTEPSEDTHQSGDTPQDGTSTEEDNDFYIWIRKALWTPEEEEYYNEHYRGLDGYSYDCVKMTYNEEQDYYYVTNVDMSQYPTGAWYTQDMDAPGSGVRLSFTKGREFTSLLSLHWLYTGGGFGQTIYNIDNDLTRTFGNWLYVTVEQAILNEFRMSISKDQHGYTHNGKYYSTYTIHIVLRNSDGTEYERDYQNVLID